MKKHLGQPVDPRTTFLRWHLAKECRRIDDILPLQEFRQQLLLGAERPAEQGETLDQLLRPHEFFYREKPEEQLYLPLPLVPEATLPSISGTGFDGSQVLTLTAIIQWLDASTTNDRNGIVLKTRSGGG